MSTPCSLGAGAALNVCAGVGGDLSPWALIKPRILQQRSSQMQSERFLPREDSRFYAQAHGGWGAGRVSAEEEVEWLSDLANSHRIPKAGRDKEWIPPESQEGLRISYSCFKPPGLWPFVAAALPNENSALSCPQDSRLPRHRSPREVPVAVQRWMYGKLEKGLSWETENSPDVNFISLDNYLNVCFLLKYFYEDRAKGWWASLPAVSVVSMRLWVWSKKRRGREEEEREKRGGKGRERKKKGERK